MARCKLTSMNLRTIRKSREYQALLIDLVAMGVVGQSAAEEVLGYTIPAGLLGSTGTDDDSSSSGSDDSSSSGSDDSSSSGSDDSSSSGSDDSSSTGSDDSSSSDASDTITITVSMIKTINDTRLSSDTVSSPASLDSAQSIVVPSGSSGDDVFEALQAASIGDLTGISTPSFMTYDSVDHYVAGFDPDTAQLIYTTDTFNEDATIGVFIYQANDDSSSS